MKRRLLTCLALLVLSTPAKNGRFRARLELHVLIYHLHG